MEWYVILLIVISSLIFIIFTLSLTLHKYICKRSFRSRENEERRARKFYGKEFGDEIVRGMHELDKLPLEDIKINSYDNTELVGHLYKGSSEKIIIYSHGYHSNYRFDFSLGFKEFYDRGYSILFIEQRGHQSSKGRYTTFGLKERYDLQKWIEYVDKRYSGKAKIVLCGISMGAATVLYTLGLKLPNSVVGAICDCGFDKPFNVIRYGVKKRAKICTKFLTELVNLGSIITTGESFKSLDSKDTLKDNKLPVFIIHGTKDSICPIEMGDNNYKYTNGLGIYARVENADHGFGYIVNTELYRKCLKEFLEKANLK